MEISMYRETFINQSLNKVVSTLSSGLRADMPYSDTQVYIKVRLTASIINGVNIDLYDVELSNVDTIGVIFELENGIRSVLEPNYNIDNQHGAGISAVYSV